ncbi:MAG TPA: proprotein convertase P-domain-containing protein [Pyrinomonadaceae bacterium]|jgi:uncharacterized repeat protein (TIGR01451 family)|nr:proprotein convertase P-domain-containing protein [Pyrinomonadaceae bacterium]
MPYGYAAIFLASSPLSSTHDSITFTEIRDYDLRLFPPAELDKGEDGKPKQTKAMEDAAREISEANQAVDDPNGPQFLQSAPHFDSENFRGSQARLALYKTKVRDFLVPVKKRQKVNLKKARFFLGQALHTLQDFYSHSNWIELGNTGRYARLGQIGDVMTNPAADLKTCTDCTRDACPDCVDNLTTTELTTGYYGDDDRPKPKNNVALKCDHGGRVHVPVIGFRRDSSGKGELSDGINKDTRDCEASPHHRQHRAAATAAKEATRKYIEEIQEMVGVAKTKLLLGGGTTLAFAIDTTGSMQSIIDQVKAQSVSIIDSRIGTPEEPAKYVLVPFNDPSVGPVTVTDDPDEFKEAINALVAEGGDDCPERANTGMLQALDQMEKGGELLVFTDASSNDGHLAGNVSGLASEKNIKVSPIAFGSCSPIDPAYIRIAGDTGGQVFVLSGGEAGNITRLADFLLRANAVELLSVTGRLTGAPVSHTVPVDSTMRRLTVSASGVSSVVLRRPDGSTVRPSDAGVSLVALSSGAVYSVADPAPGAWSVTVDGSVTFDGFRDFSIRVIGESPLRLVKFELAEVRGRALHESAFPIDGLPTAGRTVQLLAETSSSEVATARFEFRSPQGAVLQTLNLTEYPYASEAADDDATTAPLGQGPVRPFFGEAALPGVPFVVYATGTDLNGAPFQRMVPGVTRPQTVRILRQPSQDLSPGQQTTYTFQVVNTGAPGTFAVSASDDNGYVVSATPQTLTLGTGETKEVRVVLRPPADAEHNDLDTLTFAVRSSSDASAYNYVIVNSIVVGELELGEVTTDPAGDGDAFLEPGEGAALNVALSNSGGDVTGVSATLKSTTPGVTVVSPSAAYPDIPAATAGTNSTPFNISLAPGFPCGRSIAFELTVNYEGDKGPASRVFTFTAETGRPSATPAVFSYAGPPVAMPFSPGGVNVPIRVEGFTGEVSDLNFRIDSLDHFYVGALEVTLTSPRGTSVRLVDSAWNGGANFRGTLLDDESAGPSIRLINWWEEPHTGTYKPVQPLTTLDGEDPNGVWVLNVRDPYYWWYSPGRVNAFSLLISGYECGAPSTDSADLSVAAAASPATVLSGSTVTYTTTVSNHGPGEARGVVVTNQLPPNATPVSCAATGGGSCGPTGGSATFASLPAGASATVTVVASVACETPNGAALNYVSSVASLTNDPDPSNNSALAAAAVSNPAPVISGAAVDKPQIWSPNHQMVDVTVSYEVSDNCGPVTSGLAVTSNEPPDGAGDGHTSSDWEVVDAHHVRLRAERSGGGGGRTYTITITSTDSAGNSSSQTVTVSVPHSSSK